MLREAGFAAVQVVDTGKDLNAYAKVEGGEGCCSPADRVRLRAAGPPGRRPRFA